MGKTAHSSSHSKFKETAGVGFKKESELKRYRAKHTSVSSSDLYPPTTIRSARNIAGGSGAQASFSINIKKISREEAAVKFNRKSSGKFIEAVSTSNE